MARTALKRFIVAATFAALLGVVGTAAAVQDTKPVPCEGQMSTPDAAGDQEAPTGFAGAATDATDILTFFARHDAAKGAEASTLNFHVKNLALSVPSGFTSVTWQVTYKNGDAIQYVRAVVDFSGAIAYEYGDVQPVEADGETVTSSSIYRGDTTGKMFEGADGVVQVVVPADRGGKAGSQITELLGETRVGRTVPNSVKTPSRGLANTLDQVPEEDPDGQAPAVNVTQTPCGDSGGSQQPPTTEPNPPGGGNPQPPSAGGPATLPIKVGGKVKATRKKRLVVPLRSTERVTNVAARLRKGSKALGSGKLAALDGKGKLALKLSRKIKKGKYTLDLAGDRANGQRAISSLSLRIR